MPLLSDLTSLSSTSSLILESSSSASLSIASSSFLLPALALLKGGAVVEESRYPAKFLVPVEVKGFRLVKSSPADFLLVLAGVFFSVGGVERIPIFRSWPESV